MKKVFVLIAAVFASFLLASCEKKETADEFGWYSDFDEAKKLAQKDNKSIILYFSALDSDGKSEDFNSRIFKTAEFKEKFSPEYVLCNIDFSNSRFNDVYGAAEENSDSASVPGDEKSESSAKKAKRSGKENSRRQKKLSQDMLLPSYYAADSLPSFFILTKQGYVISPLLVEENYNLNDVQNEIEKSSDRKKQVSNLLDTISTGKIEDALKAIDELYSTTADEHKFLLEELLEKYIKLDKENKSGGTVDCIFELANARAQKAFFENDYEKAIECLELPLKYDILTPENRLQAYYSVGYFLAMSGSTDYDRIIDYFQKAYDSAPESEYAPKLQQMIENLSEMKSKQGYAPEKTEDSASEAKAE